jgi:hypothetical protein
MNTESKAPSLLTRLRRFRNGINTKEVDRLSVQAWAALRIRQVADATLQNGRLNASDILVTEDPDRTLKVISERSAMGGESVRLLTQFIIISPDNKILIGRTDSNQQSPKTSLEIEMRPFNIDDMEAITIVMQQMRVASRQE